MNGPRRYSVDLKQDGLELSADFCLTSLNEKLFLRMKEKTMKEVLKCKKQKQEVEQKKEKKKKKKLKKKKFSEGYINISSNY